jgi:hypothetical protein
MSTSIPTICPRTLAVIAALGATLGTVSCGDAQGGRESAGDGPGLTGLTGDTEGDDMGEAGTAEDDGAQGQDDGGPGGDDADGGGLPVFDVGAPAGTETCAGEGNAVGEDFSYIWVANSPENTISKINTQTLVEEGRYETRDTFGNPSRTSVALSGHMAVANRSGGLTKYYAYDCPDPIGTSTGPADVYPFGTDGCFAWHTPMNCSSQRPVAWTPGTFNEDTCSYEDELLWSACYNGGTQIDAVRLDGETGAILDTVNVQGIVSDSFGAYGGASDSEGNFWFSQLGTGRLVRVDAQTLTYEVWNMPISGYGMAVDGKDRAWICGSGVARFDYATGMFATSNNTDGSAAGCMADQTHIWLAGGSNVRGINLESMNVEHNHPIASYIHGTSIDFHGNVWGVSRDTRAYRVDPATGMVGTVDGLNSPYTYSDMTGYGLANSVGPQG